MGALIIFAVVIAAIAVFDVLAFRFGVDSRIDSPDPRRSGYRVGIN
jgi:hypothetical protein